MHIALGETFLIFDIWRAVYQNTRPTRYWYDPCCDNNDASCDTNILILLSINLYACYNDVNVDMAFRSPGFSEKCGSQAYIQIVNPSLFRPICIILRHYALCNRWAYHATKLFIFSKHELLRRWSLGMVKRFHPARYLACDNLSMEELNLIHVSKRGPYSQAIKTHNSIL